MQQSTKVNAVKMAVDKLKITKEKQKYKANSDREELGPRTQNFKSQGFIDI